MRRLPHGAMLSLDALQRIRKSDGEVDMESAVEAAVKCPELTRYGYMFPNLQNTSENLLPEAAVTIANLIRLGITMRDNGSNAPQLDSDIPSAYTYFAQFVDHDITLEAASQNVKLEMDFGPLSPDEIKGLKNTRSPGLDLDSVYGPGVDQNGCYEVPRTGDLLTVERAIPIGPRPPDVDPDNSDLPREPTGDHPAKIADRRNDTHLIISQMHLAFMRAHNAIVARGNSFEKARKLLRQHYQWIVIKDFLGRIADGTMVNDVLSGALNIYDPPDDDFFMPLEFTVAAYRFGHSMVRAAYDYNGIFQNGLKASLFQLLMPGALAPTQGYHHILESWIIQWDKFLAGGSNKARRIDTRLVEPLAALPGMTSSSMSFSLAVRDLLRGYLLRLPTGQAVARSLGYTPLTAAEIEAVGETVSLEQKQVLQDSQTNFSSRTPLWFYLLAEAANSSTGRLGKVGSALVSSVLIALVRRSKDSYMREQNWSPTLGEQAGRFDLRDLFKLAGVLKT